MPNYSALKALINQDITTNGQGDITGAILNQLLKNIVDSLGAGYQFAGIATPSTNPGNPDQRVFYLATAAGTYTYFGGLSLPNGVNILKFDSTWVFQNLFQIDSAATENSDHLITSGAVFNAIVNANFLGRVNQSYFVGAGTTYSYQKLYGLIPGHTYRFYFTDWDATGIVSDNYKWEIREKVAGASESSFIYGTLGYDTIVPSHIDFTPSANVEWVSVGGRAVDGQLINFSYVDITALLELGYIYNSIDDAVWALRKQTSNMIFNDDPQGTRLRILFFIKQGSRLHLSTSDNSGIYVSLFQAPGTALWASPSDAIENYTNSYISSVDAVASQDGWLGISMTNGSTAISDSRKAEMLQSLSILIYDGFLGDMLDSLMGLNSDVAQFNADMNGALVSVGGANTYKQGGYSSPIAYKKNLSLLLCSDIHGTFESIKRAVDYANLKTSDIDYVACLGDIVLRSPADSIQGFTDAFAKSQLPFLFVVGNHDTADTDLAAITEAQARTKYFQQIQSKGWISNFKDSSSCSWYKDDATHKVRIISVFEYGNSQQVSTGAPGTYCRRWIPTATLQWFADTLYSTQSDYSVVVLLHQVPFFPATYVEGKFTISSTLRISLQQFFLNTVDGNPFGDIVDAFINGTNISKTYQSIASYSLGKTATVSKNFSSRGTGKFICFCVGHFHGSYIFKDATYPNQITVAVPSDSRSVYQQQYGDTNYVPNQRNEDQFYVIGFDTINHLINIAKIGGQVTNDMIRRDIISIPYQ